MIWLSPKGGLCGMRLYWIFCICDEEHEPAEPTKSPFDRLILTDPSFVQPFVDIRRRSNLLNDI